MLSCIVAAIVLSAIQGAAAASTMTLATDRTTYSPAQTVIVSGSLHTAQQGLAIKGAIITVEIIDPLHRKISLESSPPTDIDGHFKHSFSLASDAVSGQYRVDAYWNYQQKIQCSATAYFTVVSLVISRSSAVAATSSATRASLLNPTFTNMTFLMLTAVTISVLLVAGYWPSAF